MEWLDDVVVGAGAQSVNFVLPAIARRQNQNRIGLALLARLANDVQARHFRQAREQGKTYREQPAPRSEPRTPSRLRAATAR